MNRSYIFCHMMMSLDGKIMGSYMNTPEGTAAGDVFSDYSPGKPAGVPMMAFYQHPYTTRALG